MSGKDRTPTQEARGIAAALMRSYIVSGQPMEDCGCDGCPRCKAVVRALEKLEERLDTGSVRPPEPATFVPGDAATGKRWQWVREDGDG